MVFDSQNLSSIQIIISQSKDLPKVKYFECKLITENFIGFGAISLIYTGSRSKFKIQ